MIDVKLTPAWEAPEWMLIMRATWMDAQVRREAAAEIYRRNLAGSQIELSARPLRHQAMLEQALVASDLTGRLMRRKSRMISDTGFEPERTSGDL